MEPVSRAGQDAGREYNASVPPEVRDLTPALSHPTIELARTATAELTRFDSEVGHEVATFAPLLLLSEAASSSQIENLTASARSILSAELGVKGGRNAEQIVANARAMTAAVDLAGDITPSSILRMHEVLMASQPRHTPGAWRSEPVWIGTSSESPIGAVFVAPQHRPIEPRIEDLTEFAVRRDLDPLAQVAIAHAQFAAIHPFTDGNGRTGRALAQSMLRQPVLAARAAAHQLGVKTPHVHPPLRALNEAGIVQSKNEHGL